jgi:hypothetical protein
MEESTMNKYRIYTGPTLVDEVANRLSEYYTVTIRGTEHAYIETVVDGPNQILDTLTRACNLSGFTLRDIQTLLNDVSVNWTPETARMRVGGTFGS